MTVTGVASVYDVAIVGGGIAGAVAANRLARAGRTAVLFEKEAKAHPKVCGEFVSGEGAAIIASCGIDFARLGGVRIDTFHVHGPYHSVGGKLPQVATGLSRARLDDQLLRAASAAGADVRRGVVVRDIVHGAQGGRAGEGSTEIALLTEGGEFRARRLIMAAGKSDLTSVQKRVGRDSRFVGFKQHLELRPSLAKKMRNACDLFVFEHGYGGLSPVEDGHFNFCFVIEKSALRKIGSDWNSLAFHIAKHNWQASRYLDGAVPLFRHPVTIATVPYGFVRRAPPPPGVYFVGDQMAVIPSLTGDGMSIAAMTGAEAARAILDPAAKSGLAPARRSSLSYQKAMRSRLRRQVGTGFRLHRLFRNPRLVDFTLAAIKPFPFVLDFLFATTRLRRPFSPGALLGARSRRRFAPPV